MRKGRSKRQGGSEGRGAQASGHSGEEGGGGRGVQSDIMKSALGRLIWQLHSGQPEEGSEVNVESSQAATAITQAGGEKGRGATASPSRVTLLAAPSLRQWEPHQGPCSVTVLAGWTSDVL